jgi:hypothetical protein
VDSILGALPAASVRLFNASRNGEWLNQTIPCGAVGRTADGKPIATTQTTPTCNPAFAPQPPAGPPGSSAASDGAASLSGAQAVSRMMQP